MVVTGSHFCQLFLIDLKIKMQNSEKTMKSFSTQVITLATSFKYEVSLRLTFSFLRRMCQLHVCFLLSNSMCLRVRSLYLANFLIYAHQPSGFQCGRQTPSRQVTTCILSAVQFFLLTIGLSPCCGGEA